MPRRHKKSERKAAPVQAVGSVVDLCQRFQDVSDEQLQQLIALRMRQPQIQPQIAFTFTQLQQQSNAPWADQRIRETRHDFDTLAERLQSHFNVALTERSVFSPVHDTHRRLQKRKLLANPVQDMAPMLENYIRELWLSELPPPETVNTSRLLTHIPNNDQCAFERDLHGMAPQLPSDELASWWVTISNLYRAAKGLFTDAGIEGLLADSPHLQKSGETVSIPLLKSIHTLLMKGLVDTHGRLRTESVSPLGSGVSYAPHRKVEDHLRLLCDETNRALATVRNLPDDSIRLQQALAAAGVFFSHFLWIHPFDDGNGRTARIALSLVLRNFTLVPISLYVKTGSRKDYVDALETSHTYLDCLPFRVLDYVSFCACLTVSNYTAQLS